MEKNQQWKDWGIKEHWNIPDDLLDAMDSTTDFDINRVKESAKRLVEIYIEPKCWLPTPMVEIVEQMIEGFRHESIPILIKTAQSPENNQSVIAYGQIVEYSMVADALEEFIRDQS